jgi:hypothetical protein
MDSVRTKRLTIKWYFTRQERGRLLRSLLQRYALDQPEGYARVLPSVADLYARSSVVRDIIDTPLTEEEENTVTEESFNDAVALLPALVETWRQEESRKLLALLPKEVTHSLATKDAPAAEDDVPNELARLGLATSLFACTQCKGQTFHHANILAHSCRARRSYYGIASENPEQAIYDALGAVPRDSDQASKVSSDTTAVSTVKHLIELCELDANTATPKDMDEHDARFTCIDLECFGQRQAMDWRHAVCMSTYAVECSLIIILRLDHTLSVT